MLTLVVYIPLTHVEGVKSALFEAGAGRYRNYDCCSWQVEGTGQFRPLEGSDPYLGTQNQTESVPEARVEMICEDEHLPAVIAAIRASHPYEEPAFSVCQNIDV